MRHALNLLLSFFLLLAPMWASRDFTGAVDDIGQVTAPGGAGGQPTGLKVNTFSISWWMDADAANGIVAFFGAGNPTFGWNIYIDNATSRIRLELDTSAGISSILGTSNVVTGGWFHILFGYDAVNYWICVNGVQENTGAKTGTVDYGTARFQFANYYDGTLRYNGRLAEFAYWDVAFACTSTEVAALSKGAPAQTIRRNHLLLHVPFWGLANCGPLIDYEGSGTNYYVEGFGIYTKGDHCPCAPFKLR